MPKQFQHTQFHHSKSFQTVYRHQSPNSHNTHFHTCISSLTRTKFMLPQHTTTNFIMHSLHTVKSRVELAPLTSSVDNQAQVGTLDHL
ncbi:hypothetical protein VIGAN_03143800, partial [Vigna angularis var. angularis]